MVPPGGAPSIRGRGMWSVMARFWLDVIGIALVITIVFVLVALCERERH